MNPLRLASWLLTGRYTAAAPGTTEFLGDALAAVQAGRAPAREPGAFVLIFSVLWKLLFVLGLIWVMVWLLRRTLRPGGIAHPGGGPVRVLASTHLDARHAVYLLEIGQRMLVVGAGGDSLTLLAEIVTPAEQATLRETLREPVGKFGSYLAAWTARMAGGGGTGEQLREGSAFLKERLEARQRKRRGGPEA